MGIIGISHPASDVIATVRDRKVIAELAGQREVRVTLDYVGPDWRLTSVHRLIHSTFGGYVFMILDNGDQVRVDDPNAYGDTARLDDEWFRHFYHCEGAA